MFLYLSPCLYSFIRITCKLHATVSRSCSWKLIKMSYIYILKKKKVSIVRVCLQPLGQFGHNRAFLLNLWPLESCMGSLWEDKKEIPLHLGYFALMCVKECASWSSLHMCVFVFVCVCVWCSRGPVQCQLNQVSAGQTVNTVSLPSSTPTPDHLPCRHIPNASPPLSCVTRRPTPPA